MSIMLYDGKGASLLLQSNQKARAALLPHPPVLAVLSVSTHPSIASFIAIKRRYAHALGVTMEEYSFPASATEDDLIAQITSLSSASTCDGIIVQLPLPSHFDTDRVLNAIPRDLDVDCLGADAWDSFTTSASPVPPVASAVAHILHDANVDLTDKHVVVIGYGRLVGAPVTTWFIHQGVIPAIIEVDTDDRTRERLYREADIIVSGIGQPHHLKPEQVKDAVILIDAGTSEQSGTLAGDCDPRCAEKASLLTPVPGGVGPLTVAFLFENVIVSAEHRN